MIRTITTTVLCAILTMPSFAADVTYRNDVKPMLKAQCESCHGDKSPTLADFDLDKERYAKAMQGPRISTYETLLQLVGWPDTGALMRRLDDGANTADRKPGNMYMHLGATDAERAANLKILKAWVGEGAWHLNRWKAKGDVPGITKEQLEKIKVEY